MQTSSLVGTTVSGMFNLRLLLRDATTEEHANIIFKHMEAAYDKYRARAKVRLFTPTFRVVQDAAQQMQLEIVAPYNSRPVAKVRLSTHHVGAETILTIAEHKPARRAKPIGQAKHINAGYCLNEIRRQLRQDPDIAPQVRRLSSDAIAQIESFLDTCQMRSQAVGVYTLDMDLTDEGLTLIAYVDHKRMCAVSVFF